MVTTGAGFAARISKCFLQISGRAYIGTIAFVLCFEDWSQMGIRSSVMVITFHHGTCYELILEQLLGTVEINF
jgi:hypothetical protein